MRLFIRVFPLLVMLIALHCPAQDIQRFPPPDFESGYSFPTTQTPLARGLFMSYVDVAVLFAALSIASYFVIKKRDRDSIFYLGIFSLVYFGFYREGCVCAIGAVQNVTLAIFDPTYTLPFAVVAFFLLPLIFTLFFGRVFCAGVCPLGAIQDLVLVKPIKLPKWLHQALGMLAYVYLGAAVLFAALGSAFIICKYDPFVSFFRLSGSLSVIMLGVSLLVIGLFVGRPYCLYLCPYSVLLKWFSQFSQWRVTVGPNEGECIQCDSCGDACPFDAITHPTPEEMPNPMRQDRKRLAVLIALVPVFIIVGAWLVSFAGPTFSKMDYTVRLAERIALEESGQVEGTTDASKAYRDSGQSKVALFEEAHRIREKFQFASWILGGFLGLALAGKLIALSIFQKREIYEAERSNCLACGRCFCSCPLERKRLRQLKSASFV